jgi:hypothetical protein
MVGSSVANRRSSAADRSRHAVEQVGHQRWWPPTSTSQGAAAADAMQPAGAPDLVELTLIEPCGRGSAADRPRSGFHPARREAEAAALPLGGSSCGPGGQPIIEVRQLDLEPSFGSGGALAEYLEDQASAVLCVVSSSSSLLDRAQRGINDQQRCIMIFSQRPISSTAPCRAGWPVEAAETKFLADDVNPDRLGGPTASAIRASRS